MTWNVALVSIVWQSVESLSIEFADKPAHNLVSLTILGRERRNERGVCVDLRTCNNCTLLQSTGFADMVALLPDSNVEIDQFIIRFLGKVYLLNVIAAVAALFLSRPTLLFDFSCLILYFFRTWIKKFFSILLLIECAV
jgi:hypothetical protein